MGSYLESEGVSPAISIRRPARPRAGDQLSNRLARSRRTCSQLPRRKLTTSITPLLAQCMFKTFAPPRVSSHTSRFVPRPKEPIENRTVPRSTPVSSCPEIDPGLPCLAAILTAAAFSSGSCTLRFDRTPAICLLTKQFQHQEEARYQKSRLFPVGCRRYAQHELTAEFAPRLRNANFC
jgi:hypothetical protein